MLKAKVSIRLKIAGFGMLVALCAAGQTKVDLKMQGKNVDFSGAASTRPFRTGAELPTACKPGEFFFKTDAQPGRNLFACTAPDVWTAGGGVDASGQAGKVLTSDGAETQWTAPGGDVAGAPDAIRVRRVQGRPVADAAPADGEVLRWNGASGQWEPNGVPGGAANGSFAFTNQAVFTIPGSLHKLGTPNVLVDCYGEGTPNTRLEPSMVSVDPVTFDISVQFGAVQSGRCVVNGAGGSSAQLPLQNNTFAGGTTQTFLGSVVASSAERTAPVKTGTSLPGSCSVGDQFFKSDAAAGENLHFCTAANTWTQMRAGGAVATVFGRSGAVAAQTGDYNFGQIAGVIANAQIGSGIDASKIGTGSVTSGQFGYLGNVTSDIQAQLDGKAASSHGHALAGDLAGDMPVATVRGLQGRALGAGAPSDGQALVWNAAGNAWIPGTVGAASAGMGSQLGDLRVERVSAATLIVGRSCAAGSPCNVRFGNLVYSITSACTADISGGTGTAFVYIDGGGTLTVGHNLSVSASGNCQSQPNVTSFPADSIPLAMWTAVSGTWDDAGGRDVRAWLSTKTVTAGSGIMTIESAGRTTVSVDPAVVPAYATAAATLNFGPIAAGTCSADLSFPVPGVVAGNAVAPGWPAALEPGLTGIMRVSAANTVAVRLCNISSAAIDPVGAAFRATVVTNF